jgi:hypothetical protein
LLCPPRCRFLRRAVMTGARPRNPTLADQRWLACGRATLDEGLRPTAGAPCQGRVAHGRSAAASACPGPSGSCA